MYQSPPFSQDAMKVWGAVAAATWDCGLVVEDFLFLAGLRSPAGFAAGRRNVHAKRVCSSENENDNAVTFARRLCRVNP
jgi:hypothetical protein